MNSATTASGGSPPVAPIQCQAARYGHSIRFAKPIGTTKMYLSLVQCEGTARAGTVLCEACHIRHNGGLGHSYKRKAGFTDWHGWICNLRPESHIIGSEWYEKKKAKATPAAGDVMVSLKANATPDAGDVMVSLKAIRAAAAAFVTAADAAIAILKPTPPPCPDGSA